MEEKDVTGPAVHACWRDAPVPALGRLREDCPLPGTHETIHVVCSVEYAQSRFPQQPGHLMGTLPKSLLLENPM